MSLCLSPVAPFELAAVDEVCRSVAAEPGRATAGPGWSSPAELLAGLDPSRLESEETWLAARDGERIAGWAGLRAGCPGRGFLIGPVVHAAWPQRPVLDRLLPAVEEIARGWLKQIRARVVPSNAELGAALAARGWAERERSVEMKWLPDPGLRLPDPSGPEIRRLSRHTPDADLAAVAALLSGACEAAGDAPPRLGESLMRGFVDSMWDGGRCLAAMVWGRVPATDCGRIRYLAVAEEERGRGLGSALLQRALDEASFEGIFSLYLRATEDSAGMHLCAHHGFEVTQRSVLFDCSL